MRDRVVPKPFWLCAVPIHFGTKCYILSAHFGRDASACAKTWSYCSSIGEMLFMNVRCVQAT
jgi:hypothetical protein